MHHSQILARPLNKLYLQLIPPNASEPGPSERSVRNPITLFQMDARKYRDFRVWLLWVCSWQCIGIYQVDDEQRGDWLEPMLLKTTHADHCKRCCEGSPPGITDLILTRYRRNIQNHVRPMGEKHSPCHSRHVSELFAQIKCLCREDWVSRAKEARPLHRTRLSEMEEQEELIGYFDRTGRRQFWEDGRWTVDGGRCMVYNFGTFLMSI